MKKILLLGGSVYLLPVIEEIHKLGYYAITCDYLPNNIAHKYSDEYHNVSITDKDAVLDLSKKLGIDGIMSFATDPGVVTSAYVAERLGLPMQAPYKSVQILQNKGLFRKFLADNGFNTPKSYHFENFGQAQAVKEYFDYPMIVKPVDSAGSKGVTKIVSSNDLENAFNYAKANSICKQVIIEDYITQDGCSSDSDCFVVDGKLQFVSFSNQYFDSNAINPYVPSAYSWPSTMRADKQQELASELQRLMTLLDVKTSIFNIETRYATNGKTYIMEVSPRGGGNKLSEMLHLATGVNLIENAVKSAVGEATNIPNSFEYQAHFMEIILHSDQNGVFHRLNIDSSMMPYVIKVDLLVKEGDIIEQFSGANKTLGTIALKFDDIAICEEVIRHIDDYIKIIVK